MAALSFLETSAEIAATLAGLISIFLVLARRDGSFEPAVAFLIRLVVIGSIGSMFFAAVPLVLANLGLNGHDLWRSSSAVMLAACVAVSVYVARNRSLIRRNVLVPVAVFFNVTVLVTLICNVSGWPAPPSGGVYLLSVWLIVGIVSLNFVDLVFHELLGSSAA